MTQTQKRWTMVAVILGSGIVFLDTTVVTLALPRIGQELPSGLIGVLEGQSYVANGYLVTLSALLILAGAMNDYFGRSRMFGIGLLSFGATSLMCGLAPNLELLILFRVLQGASGALLVPGSLSIITATFQGEERGRAFGVWAGASAVTTIIGPVVGGVLVNSVSWRAAFLINVPLLAVAYYATRRHVPESRDTEATGQFDWLGAGVVVLAVAGLSFGAIRGQQSEWQDSSAFVALAVGAVATAAFPILMSRRPNPLVPLDLFRSRNFSVTNISTFLIYGALYVTLGFAGIFLIGTLGYNEPGAGIAGLPSTLLLALLSTRFGGLAGRYGPRTFMAVGPLLMAAGLLWLARIPMDSAPWVFGFGSGQTLLPPADYLVDILPGYVVFGFGLAIMVAPLTTALMSSVPEHNSGVASAINNAISRVGPPLAGALIFIAIAGSFYDNLADRAPAVDVSSPAVRRQISPLNPPPEDADPTTVSAVRGASTDAFSMAMIVSAGLMVLGAGVNAFGIHNPKRGERAGGEAVGLGPDAGAPVEKSSPEQNEEDGDRSRPCTQGPVPTMTPVVTEADLP